MAASGRRAIDNMEERQARTFSAAIRKGSLPGVAAPALASAIEPPAPIQTPSIAVAPDSPAEVLPVQTALAAPAQVPVQALPPAPVAITEPIAAMPSAAAPSVTAEKAAPAPAAPAVPSPQEVLNLLSSLVAERKSYPEAARRRKAQGSVGIAMKVAADGSLAAAAIQKKSGSAILDRAALDLVKGLFPITLRPGEPMEVALSIEYRLVP
jgi:protein TonB